MTTLERLMNARKKVLRILWRKFTNMSAEDIEELFDDYIFSICNQDYSDISDDKLHSYMVHALSTRCFNHIRDKRRSQDLCDHLNGSLSDDTTVVMADNHQAREYKGELKTEFELKQSNKRYHILMSWLLPAHRRIAAYVFIEEHTRAEASEHFKLPEHTINYILDRVVRPTLRLAVQTLKDYDTK